MLLVREVGFEPTVTFVTDLQSVPFDLLDTPPITIIVKNGIGTLTGNRTPVARMKT